MEIMPGDPFIYKRLMWHVCPPSFPLFENYERLLPPNQSVPSSTIYRETASRSTQV
jgi:hypothetical protein